jgi:phosphatidylserine/phosphatidylglycerophosphate/cardiolipin synthase-like enzyme
VPYIAPKGNWHAKVAIAFADQVPKAAVIGSSNLTNKAFQVGREAFNFECDVAIWVNEPSVDKAMLSIYQRPHGQMSFLGRSGFGPIIVVPDPRTEKNEQLLLEEIRDEYARMKKDKQITEYTGWNMD